MKTILVPEVAQVHYETITNGRQVNADYAEVCHGACALAVTITDGVDDDYDAGEVAQIAAQVSAVITATTCDPVEGLRMAKQYVDDRNALAPRLQEGTCTATVAAIRSGSISLAWRGDSPAWGRPRRNRRRVD